MEEYLLNKIEELSFERIGANDPISEVLDSITTVEFVAEIEDEFGIEVPFDEIVESNFKNVTRLIEFIKEKQA